MVHFDLRSCALCGNAFVSAGASSVCNECRAELDEVYAYVRDFLRAHPKLTPTVQDLSQLLDLDEKYLQALVEDGRIQKVEPGRGRRNCQSCGVSIAAGNLCVACSRRIHADILKDKKNFLYIHQKYRRNKRER